MDTAQQDNDGGDAAPHSLAEVLDRMDGAGAGNGDGSVSVEAMLEALGQRSYGPLLLVPSLVIVSPLSGIPGLPSVMAVIMAIIAAQMLVGRKHVWLPRRLLALSVPRRRLDQATGFLKPAASVIDRIIRPRLTALTRAPFSRLIAGIVILLCMAMLPLELLPFTNSLTGAAIAVFGLAMVARDGAVAILAIGLALSVSWIGVTALL